MYSAAELQNHINTNYPVTCVIKEHQKANHILLDTLIVNKKYRRQGIGSEVMRLITEYADSKEGTITLILSEAYGSSAPVLEAFYRRHGFTLSDTIQQGDSLFQSMVR